MFSFNETIKYPEDLVREGHTFNGWSSKPERMGTENITVRAQWNVTKPSEFVEIVFSTKDLSEEKVKKIIKEYVQEGASFLSRGLRKTMLGTSRSSSDLMTRRWGQALLIT